MNLPPTLKNGSLPSAEVEIVPMGSMGKGTQLHPCSPVTRRARKRTKEQGYILLAVLFMVVLVLIALSIAAPKVAADIERDREMELMHRGKQYRRAIQLYYKKFGAYPPNMDALEKTSEIRFLRKRYKDPVTGKDEWHLIHFGENKLPTVMGFFGQAGSTGSTMAGTGPGGVGQSVGGASGGGAFGSGNGIGGSSIGSSSSSFGGSSFGGSSGIGGSSFGGSGIGGSSFGGSSQGGSSFGGSGLNGSGSNGSGSNNSSTGTSSSTDPNSGTNGGASTTSSTGTSTDPNAPNSSGTGSSANPGGSIFGSGSSNGNGQTFGGGGIIGVESTSPKVAILEYKKKKHFNEWEFVYDPQQERQQLSNNTGTVGQPMSGAGNGNSPTSPSLLNSAPGSSTNSPSSPNSGSTNSPLTPGSSSPQ